MRANWRLRTYVFQIFETQKKAFGMHEKFISRIKFNNRTANENSWQSFAFVFPWRLPIWNGTHWMWTTDDRPSSNSIINRLNRIVHGCNEYEMNEKWNSFKHQIERAIDMNICYTTNFAPYKCMNIVRWSPTFIFHSFVLTKFCCLL